MNRLNEASKSRKKAGDVRGNSTMIQNDNEEHEVIDLADEDDMIMKMKILRQDQKERTLTSQMRNVTGKAFSSTRSTRQILKEVKLRTRMKYQSMIS